MEPRGQVAWGRPGPSQLGLEPAPAAGQGCERRGIGNAARDLRGSCKSVGAFGVPVPLNLRVEFELVHGASRFPGGGQRVREGGAKQSACQGIGNAREARWIGIQVRFEQAKRARVVAQAAFANTSEEVALLRGQERCVLVQQSLGCGGFTKPEQDPGQHGDRGRSLVMVWVVAQKAVEGGSRRGSIRCHSPVGDRAEVGVTPWVATGIDGRCASRGWGRSRGR